MKKSAKFWLVIALCLCLIGTLGASFVQSSGGKVEIRQQTLETPYGPLNILIYKPKTATVDNPAPGVVVCSGMCDNLQKQADYAVELSRRGCVVVAMDQVYHGNSGEFATEQYVTNDEGRYFDVKTQSFVDSKADATNFQSHGMIEVVEYMYNCMGYVDKDRIGCTGHSQGGVNATRTMRFYHYQGTVGDGINKIHAMFSQSCNEATLPGEMDGVDVGYIIGQNDEIFLFTYYAQLGKGLNSIPEVLEWHKNELMTNEAMYYAEPADVKDSGVSYSEYVYNKDGDIRVFNTNSGDHCVQHWSPSAIAYGTDLFMRSFDMNPGIEPTKQVWQIKEFFNGVGLLGFFMFIGAFAGVMIQTPFFKTLAVSEETVEERKFEKPSTTVEKVVYWAGIIILGFLPGFLFPTLMGQSWMTNNMAFSDQTMSQFTQFVFGTGLIMIAFVILVYFVFFRKKATAANFGLSFKGEADSDESVLVKICKTILLALIVCVVSYSIVFISVGLFNVDYRFFEMGVCTFTWQKFSHYFAYIIFWLVWAAGVALAGNLNYRKGMNERAVMAITSVINAVGLGVLLIPYYTSFARNGLPAKDYGDIYRTFPMIPTIAIVTLLSRRLYKKTGNIWLSTLIVGLMICLITLANLATFHFWTWPGL
ncbi:MAG: hypothetical protein IJJ67_05475 [Oscillospiraceae bacterium]|nr:hypothetical protein [Oscillospiraceae bacterium]